MAPWEACDHLSDQESLYVLWTMCFKHNQESTGELLLSIPKKKKTPSSFKEETQASAQLIKLLEIILAPEDVLANSQVHLHPFLQIIRPLPMV